MIFDRTQRSILVVCACGAREIHPTQADADAWVVAHLARCQDVAERARALTASRARHSRNM